MSARETLVPVILKRPTPHEASGDEGYRAGSGQAHHRVNQFSESRVRKHAKVKKENRHSDSHHSRVIDDTFRERQLPQKSEPTEHQDGVLPRITLYIVGRYSGLMSQVCLPKPYWEAVRTMRILFSHSRQIRAYLVPKEHNSKEAGPIGYQIYVYQFNEFLEELDIQLPELPLSHPIPQNAESLT